MAGQSEVIDIDIQPERVLLRTRVLVQAGDGGRPTVVPLEPHRWLAVLGQAIGKTLELHLSRAKERRSLLANNYLWGIVYEDTLAGLKEKYRSVNEPCPFEDRLDLHDAMKYKFLGVEVVNIPGGEPIERPSTTTKLSPSQFSVYVEEICAWAANLGIYVRQPNEQVSA